ncbi:nitrous oxide reductase accessory protein NosL [Flavobacterium sinopsychrotolerans]|jgi:copper chaperone NosL|uniref:Copper chaperone NosL n=1 Tax=Flavobacterium sinopsychrotolerans TaxID=604089 RepID=A0A1H8I1H5_9FLAO|nr:nitrous oxide reductase accessory protein NosL [Flavobacterium sinopsychrotolerans]SEN62580.1 copper chaperone NosL [Flavobacterium sinopsychrotolerans]
MNNPKISTLSKVMLLLVMVLLVSSVFVPMWRIELSAPQYPEGLVLQLHANKIGGDVEIINGLNHYIGMKTLHKEDFIEFTVLPYIIGFFALCALAVAVVAKKKGLYALFISFILFGILAGVDFYRWNYEYGHNLDPNAAIQVPGMSYQPPLIGYKQLLNFGAYSIPDIGGWMLIASGFLLFLLVIKETNLLQKFQKSSTTTALFVFLSLSFFSCAKTEVVPIKLNVDTCDFCKMTIADGKYAAEVISEKGRVFKFDDIMCMIHYGKENSNTKMTAHYVNDYTQDNVLIPAKTAFFLSGGTVQSPMRGGIIAFSSENEAKEFGIKLKAKPVTWEAVSTK